jgi:hypothetical protein
LLWRSTIHAGYSGLSALALSSAASSSVPRRSEVVAELVDGLGADDDAHRHLPVQQPGERDARHRAVVALGDRPRGIDDGEGVLAIDRREAEGGAPRVVGTGGIAPELAAKRATGERAPYPSIPAARRPSAARSPAGRQQWFPGPEMG